MSRKITPADYEAWLEQDGRGFIALEPYAKAQTKILHQCSEGHQWRAKPYKIKEGKGCRDCYENKLKKIAEEYNAWLEQDGRGIVALERYVDARTPIKHQCSEGHPPWSIRPSNIKEGNGCPDCFHGHIKQIAEYPKYLEQDGRGYVALEPYAGSDTPILHQCSEGHQWRPSPTNIRRGHGCGDCSEAATDANVFYIWEDADRAGAGVYKVGITSERCADERIAICTRKNNMKANIILMLAVRDARDIERRALEIGEAVNYPSSVDGYTEFRRYTDHELGKVWQLAVRSA